MDGEAGWWTTSGNIGLPPLAKVMGVGRQQQQVIKIKKNRATGAKRNLSIGVTQTLWSSSSSYSECDMVGLIYDSSDDLLQHSDGGLILDPYF